MIHRWTLKPSSIVVNGHGVMVSRNVWEHHARALYINVPVSHEVAESLTMAECGVVPDTYGGSCWLSIVTDDLDVLSAHIMGGCYLPTPMSGWMTKCNLLVKGTVPSGLVPTLTGTPPPTVTVPGYQILSIYFESGLGGQVKISGARATQKIPSAAAVYSMSNGRTGRTMRSSLAPGTPYAANVNSGGSRSSGGTTLLHVEGSLVDLGEEKSAAQVGTPAGLDPEFVRFVVELPNKFLVQTSSGETKKRRCVYAPEDDGSGTTSFSARGCVGVKLNHAANSSSLVVVPVLRQLLGVEVANSLDFAKAVVFVQPDYILVDHDNTNLHLGS